MKIKILSRIVFWLMGFYQGSLFFTTFGPGTVSFAFASLGLALTFFWIAYGLEKDELWASQSAVGWSYGKFALSFFLSTEKSGSELDVINDAINVFGFIGSPSNSQQALFTTFDRWIVPIMIMLLLSPRKPFLAHLKSYKILRELFYETFGNKYFAILFVWTFTMSTMQIGGFSRLQQIRNSHFTQGTR